MALRYTTGNYPQVLVIGHSLGVVAQNRHEATPSQNPHPPLTATRLAQTLKELGVGCLGINTDGPERGLIVGEDEQLLPVEQVGSLKHWGPPGKVTSVIVGHCDARCPPPWQDPEQLIRSWAEPKRGAATISGHHRSEKNPPAPSPTPSEPYRKQVQRWREDALRELAERKLRVYTTSDRPLLGISSVYAVRPDGSAETDPRVATKQRHIGEFARILSHLSGAENLLNTKPIPSLGNQTGSGSGWGLAMLAAAMRGSVEPLWPAVMRRQKLDQNHPTELVIILTEELHPQTIVESIAPTAASYAAIHAAPAIAICHSHSLSRHEMAQWGLHGIYTVPKETAYYKTLNLLKSTWLPLWIKQR